MIAHFLAAGFAAADFFFAIAEGGLESWRYVKAGRGRASPAAGCARATAALPHAAARWILQRFPSTTSTGPLAASQARSAQRAAVPARAGAHAAAAAYAGLIGGAEAIAHFFAAGFAAAAFFFAIAEGGLEKLAVRESWPGPRCARRRMRAGDGGVTARRRPRDFAMLP